MKKTRIFKSIFIRVSSIRVFAFNHSSGAAGAYAICGNEASAF